MIQPRVLAGDLWQKSKQQKRLPQRHRDTENCKIKGFAVLCASVVNVWGFYFFLVFFFFTRLLNSLALALCGMLLKKFVVL
ncbi:TPA: hypothetical protein DDW35_10735 [Candidatus Sumerlaeota bacterium]|nr:hypothetical protein [Candidatus Sumerlaeota bacterium]